MSPAQFRLRLALGGLFVGFSLLVLGVLAVWHDARTDTRPDVAGPVLPLWREQASQARTLEIRTRDQHLVLRRQDGVWVLPSRGDYPALSNVMGELDEFLTTIHFETALTRDPDKYARLHIGEPNQGGYGLALTIKDDKNQALVDVIFGTGERNDGLYVRERGGARVYRISGNLPEGLNETDRWLGLDFLNIDPGTIARTRINPEDGPDYFLMKPGAGSRNFVLREPRGWRLLTAGAANGPAISSTRLRFRDVRPLSDFADQIAVAHHNAVTFTGLSLDFDFYQVGQTRWVAVKAEGRSDDASGMAMLINRRAEGWAFLVSEDAYERLARPLSDMAEYNPARTFEDAAQSLSTGNN
ncbi:DUF4340 domain-containing protein [Woodsholea maritima]|uniref:DUF4340 domain-containing protein n=1 Tax=Woodsholea maritima TaxID=240237 RepID=UPI0003732380|nr:DUF4340 domain-containing protein [Woodsholea maritima]